MRFGLIAAEEAHYPKALMCRALGAVERVFFIFGGSPVLRILSGLGGLKEAQNPGHTQPFRTRMLDW